MIGAGIIWSGLESSPDSAGILPLLCIDFRDRKELQVLLGAELVLGPSSTPSFLRPRALRMPSEGGYQNIRTCTEMSRIPLEGIISEDQYHDFRPNCSDGICFG